MNRLQPLAAFGLTLLPFLVACVVMARFYRPRRVGYALPLPAVLVVRHWLVLLHLEQPHWSVVSCGPPLCVVANCNDGVSFSIAGGPTAKAYAAGACANDYGLKSVTTK